MKIYIYRSELDDIFAKRKQLVQLLFSTFTEVLCWKENMYNVLLDTSATFPWSDFFSRQPLKFFAREETCVFYC